MWGVPLPIVVAAAIVLLALALGLIRHREPRTGYEKVACGCGWKGEVSRYAGRCPKCNAPLGEQRGRSQDRR